MIDITIYSSKDKYRGLLRHLIDLYGIAEVKYEDTKDLAHITGISESCGECNIRIKKSENSAKKK